MRCALFDVLALLDEHLLDLPGGLGRHHDHAAGLDDAVAVHPERPGDEQPQQEKKQRDADPGREADALAALPQAAGTGNRMEHPAERHLAVGRRGQQAAAQLGPRPAELPESDPGEARVRAVALQHHEAGLPLVRIAVEESVGHLPGAERFEQFRPFRRRLGIVQRNGARVLGDRQPRGEPAEGTDEFAALVDGFLVGNVLQPPTSADEVEQAAAVGVEEVGEMVDRTAPDLAGVEFADELALEAEHVLVFLVARDDHVALACLEEVGGVRADRVQEGDERGIGLRVARRAQPDLHDDAHLVLHRHDRGEEHRVGRGVHDLVRVRRAGGRHVGREGTDDERTPVALRFGEDAVDVAALALVLVVGAGGEVDLRDELALARLARQPDRATLGVERGDQPVDEVAEEPHAVAAGARQFGDLGDLLPDLGARLLQDLFLFQRRHREDVG